MIVKEKKLVGVNRCVYDRCLGKSLEDLAYYKLGARQCHLFLDLHSLFPNLHSAHFMSIGVDVWLHKGHG
jgi:hypothetical protein